MRRIYRARPSRLAAALAPFAAAVSLASLVSLAGCSTPAATNPAEGGPPHASSSMIAPEATQPDARVAPSAEVVTAPGAAAAAASGTAPADAGSSDAASGGPSGAAPAESAAQVAEEPVPNVKVTNIGMHIGGGANDAAEKDPIRRSVEPHFDAFKRCFAKAEDQKKGGDVSVDLRVDKAGGKAKLSKLKTALKGKAFEECVAEVFKAIDFRKPKGGTTNVSYSLRFAP